MVAHLVHRNAHLSREKEKQLALDKVSIDAARLLPRSHAYYTFALNGRFVKVSR